MPCFPPTAQAGRAAWAASAPTSTATSTRRTATLWWACIRRVPPSHSTWRPTRRWTTQGWSRFSNEDPASLLNIDGKKAYTLTPENYQIKVNGTALDFNDITFNNIQKTNRFMDYTIATGVSLKQGENTIELVCNNDQSMGGTTLGTAPIVDCIKITTTASLTWEPNESQLPE